MRVKLRVARELTNEIALFGSGEKPEVINNALPEERRTCTKDDFRANRRTIQGKMEVYALVHYSSCRMDCLGVTCHL